MSTLLPHVFGIAGFFSGLLLWVQFTRWLGLIAVSGSKLGGDFLGEPKRRLLWAAPFVALLHPAPWFMCAAGILGYRAFRYGGWGASDWFFVGSCLAVRFMLVMTFAFLTRWRRLSSSVVSGPNASIERTRER
jgi:hypothetical protein